MNTVQPIRDLNDLTRFKDFYLNVKPDKRNYLLIIIGLNTALRVSDILNLCWENVYDFRLQKWQEHITIIEQKTEKHTSIYLNMNVQKALEGYKYQLEEQGNGIVCSEYIFRSNGKTSFPISRVQAFRIVKKAAEKCNIDGIISCHSLRKTFGYHAWKQGAAPVLLMSIYNHSSFRVTCRYLGIEQDDKDQVFQNIIL